MKPRTDSAAKGGQSANANSVPVAAERIRVLLERLVAVYQRVLASTPAAQRYLENRGLADRSIWEQYRIGYSDGRLGELLPRDGAVQRELSALGILSKDQQELLASCLVFPILDVEGCVVTLVARSTDEREQPEKYLSGQKPRIWNAPALKSYSDLILVTSVLDALSLRMAGFDNVVAAVGTDKLPAEEIALFSALGVQNLTQLLKRDDPGAGDSARAPRPLMPDQGAAQRFWRERLLAGSRHGGPCAVHCLRPNSGFDELEWRTPGRGVPRRVCHGAGHAALRGTWPRESSAQTQGHGPGRTRWQAPHRYLGFLCGPGATAAHSGPVPGV
jgi:hypothetical protein